MHSRGPYDRRIEFRESSFLSPLVKQFLLVAVIGALGGGGYFLTRSHLIDPGMFSFGVDPSRQVAATGRLCAAPDRQSSEGEAPASESKTDQTNASVTQPHSSAPEARAQAEYVPPMQGRVLGASTDATPPSGSALDRSISALKEIADQLAATVTQLRAELGSSKQVIVSYSGPAQVTPVSAQTFAQGQRIDQLSNTTISNPTITGGSITASSIVGTISSVISTALATIDDLTSTELVAVNATFTNATSTTFYAGALGAGTANITNATTTNLATTDLRISSLDCTGYANGGTLTTDASGNVVCATDDGGAGSSVAGSDTQVQFNSGGSFAAAASFTFSSSTGKLAVPYASTTALTALGTGYFGTASTTNLIVTGFSTSTFNATESR